MEWQILDLTKASVVIKEVDHVINFLSNSVGSFSSERNQMLEAVQQRIQELEHFFAENNDGKLKFLNM
jgi:hypothetical protein